MLSLHPVTRTTTSTLREPQNERLGKGLTISQMSKPGKSLDLVTEWLLSASTKVGSAYFQLPVAGVEEPEYRERVYCYELYHRWRCHWPDGFRYSLGGEIDKIGHPIIRGGYKPDFLVHVPRQMDNLLVVEVKPKNAKIGKMVEDLNKLTEYRSASFDQDGVPGNYSAAYFWLYGLSIGEWPQRGERLLQNAKLSRQFDRSLVQVFIHPRSGEPAVQVDWP